MDYRKLGSCGLEVSQICLGAMTFGAPSWGCDEATARGIVDAFAEAGGNFIDTANIYAGGRSEEIVGRAIAGRRDEFVIATKVGNTTSGEPNSRGASRAHIIREVERSLKRLQTDYIDLYQLHYHDASVPLAETQDTLAELIQGGLIRYAGCCNFFSWQLAEANATADRRSAPRYSSSQMMYNLVRRDLEHDHFELCRRRGVGLLTYSPLHSGLLSGEIRRDTPPPSNARIAAGAGIRQVYMRDEERVWSVVDQVVSIAAEAGCRAAELALGWVVRQPAITSVIVGAQSADQLKANLHVLDLDFSGDIWDRLDEATAPAVSYPHDFYERLSWSLNRTDEERRAGTS